MGQQRREKKMTRLRYPRLAHGGQEIHGRACAAADARVTEDGLRRQCSCGGTVPLTYIRTAGAAAVDRRGGEGQNGASGCLRRTIALRGASAFVGCRDRGFGIRDGKKEWAQVPNIGARARGEAEGRKKRGS